MKKLKLFGLFFICVVHSQGCKSDLINQELSKSIDQYYFLEQKEQWELVFDLRVSEFKMITEKDYFVSQMKLDNRDWKLLKWQVVEIIKTTEDSATITIEFMEKIPVLFAKEMGNENISSMKFRERTVWQKESDQWLCRVCGKRTHLALNGDF